MCKGLYPSFTVLSNEFFLQYQISASRLSEFFEFSFSCDGFSAVFLLFRQAMDSTVALEKATLRRMRLD